VWDHRELIVYAQEAIWRDERGQDHREPLPTIGPGDAVGTAVQSLDTVLARFGKDGWELVGAPIEASGLRGLRFYFKRPTQS
jgi:hypothetical protein